MRFLRPTLDDCKRGARLAFLMLAGSVVFQGAIGLFNRRVATTNTAGLIEIEQHFAGSLLGAGVGVLIHFGLSLLAPQINAINARLQADHWREPLTMV
jgi:hypothetical protein